MKTIERQKADILDWLIVECNKFDDMVTSTDLLVSVCQKYVELTGSPHPKESSDPYIDEVFDMRICNVISEILNKEVKEIRLSDCPHISKLDKRKNIGYKYTQDYEAAMRKYELKDKLI